MDLLSITTLASPFTIQAQAVSATCTLYGGPRIVYGGSLPMPTMLATNSMKAVPYNVMPVFSQDVEIVPVFGDESVMPVFGGKVTVEFQYT